MNIDLLREQMLGHWDVCPTISQCEYQFGRRLIFVQHPKNESALPYIEGAQQEVSAAWQDIENAIAFAEQWSRSLIPEFWAAHDASGRHGFRLDVYSIHFNLSDARPVYTLSTNQDFEFEYVRYEEFDLWQQDPITEQIPEPPPNFWLQVRRTGAGEFERAA